MIIEKTGLYEETDGVIEIEKQSAKDVGEIKHIVVRSPNYTRYFYNESMPIKAAEASAKFNCTANFVAEQLNKLEDMDISKKIKLIQDILGVEFKEENLNYKHVSAEAVSIHEDGTLEVKVPNSQKAISAEAAQGEWIQYSEKSPKEKQEVYVTVYFTEGDIGRAYGYIDRCGKWHLYSAVEGELNSGYKVTAWMPLPAPYKGSDTE